MCAGHLDRSDPLLLQSAPLSLWHPITLARLTEPDGDADHEHNDDDDDFENVDDDDWRWYCIYKNATVEIDNSDD